MNSRIRNGIEIVGRPALVWRANHGAHSTVECLAAMVVDGRYRVWLVRDGTEQAASLFESTAVGIQWALDMLRDLTDQGWAKTY